MNGDLFHVCNRGMRKQKVFTDITDYSRFVVTLYKCNNRAGALRIAITNAINRLDELPTQDKLVDILKWSLLPNHYHLLLIECVDGGAVEFTKRIGNSYTKYFNTKYRSSGYLFQNKARIIPIESDEHYLHIPLYVELNPAELALQKNEISELPQYEQATRMLDFMEKYRWSSYRDYIGRHTFPRLINMDAYFENFEVNYEVGRYKKEAESWLQGKADMLKAEVLDENW